MSPNEKSPAKVLLLRQTDYNPAAIDGAVQKIFGFLPHCPVSPGDRVLLKVNLVSGHAPERRVTTDPQVVRSAARAVMDCGGHPVIADSPGIDSFRRAAEKAGLMKVAGELGIPCVELDDPVPLPGRSGFKNEFKIEAARLVIESDVVINLPKLKTHGQMLLSLGVKNLFGCVAGQAKAAWHYNVGLNRERFASLLLEIYRRVSPALTILDGVIGMDGNGPTSGEPFPYGVLAGTEDALTMDFLLCRMMNAPLETFPLWRAAREAGAPECGAFLKDTLEADVQTGDFSPDFHFKNVRLPVTRSLGFLPAGLPFASFIERALTSRPVHVPERCVGCGRCQEVCAAGALKHFKKRLRFDYSKCIRCYCCHEMCPVRAIEFRDSPLVRLVKFLNLKNKKEAGL